MRSFTLDIFKDVGDAYRRSVRESQRFPNVPGLGRLFVASDPRYDSNRVNRAAQAAEHYAIALWTRTHPLGCLVRC